MFVKVPLAFSLNPPAVPLIASWNLVTSPDVFPVRPFFVSKLAILTLTLDFPNPRLLSPVAFCSENKRFLEELLDMTEEVEYILEHNNIPLHWFIL